MIMLMLAASLLAAGSGQEIEVLARPSPVYVEESATSRSLNFDILVRNTTDAPLDVDEIAVSVYDRSGALVLRRFVDGNGTRPSIRTIDVSEVPAGGVALVFNPFHRFDRDVDLARLVYEVKLSGKKGTPVHAARLVVEPRPYVTKTPLILPMSGRMIVYDGHDFLSHHRRWDYTIPGLQQLGFTTNFMRYSYDLVPVDARGEMSSGDPARNESWPGFGRELRAAGDGRVAAVVDVNPDDRQFDPAALAGDRMKVWGNYVVIDHGNGEFSLYGHIRKGSARVKAGARVKRGDPIAAIGASGSSMFPHLHFELQTGIDTESEGLPSAFRDFTLVRGSRRVAVPSGAIDTGDIVESR
jgi:hypothetical protein